MGMYDYLGDEQIKIFYRPIFDAKDMFTGKPNTWHSGGQLRSFNKKSELPLKTWYYKYPDNFTVYDFRDNDIWIIKNTKFKKYLKLDQIKEKDIVYPVFTYYGEEFTISNLEDFYTIINDEQIRIDSLDAVSKKYFPNDDMWDIIKNNLEYFKSVENQYREEQNEVNKRFCKKWYKPDLFCLEKQLGEFLECYFFFETQKDGTVYDWHNPMQDYINCKNAAKEFINQYDGIVDKYLDWVEVTEENLSIIKETIDKITNE